MYLCTLTRPIICCLSYFLWAKFHANLIMGGDDLQPSTLLNNYLNLIVIRGSKEVICVSLHSNNMNTKRQYGSNISELLDS